MCRLEEETAHIDGSAGDFVFTYTHSGLRFLKVVAAGGSNHIHLVQRPGSIWIANASAFSVVLPFAVNLGISATCTGTVSAGPFDDCSEVMRCGLARSAILIGTAFRLAPVSTTQERSIALTMFFDWTTRTSST